MDNFSKQNKDVPIKDGKIDFEKAKADILAKLEEKCNRFLEAEMTGLLGYAKHQDNGVDHDNIRNGSYERNLDTPFGRVHLYVPRDRNGEFNTPLFDPYQRATVDVPTLINDLYKTNLSLAQIQFIVELLYGNRYSKSKLSRITDAIIEDVKAFHERPIEPDWLAVFLDATYMSVRRDSCAKEAINIAMGINRAGKCRVIDYTITPQESAENYAEMLASFKKRGMKTVKIFVSDDLAGIEGAIDRTFPQADRQRCWLHVEHTLQSKVRRIEIAQMTYEFKQIRLQPTYELAEQKLIEFCQK